MFNLDNKKLDNFLEKYMNFGILFIPLSIIFIPQIGFDIILWYFIGIILIILSSEFIKKDDNSENPI
ncbi:hypothetical protein M2325_000253 [Methanococcus voltae PS]|uniref:Uncharacterized protein n=1 Tax=Methanococcus voltae PS TaxID=523842 RepID=A0ABT2EXG3_METVO|nr:hypothetical protein [Methanococcus voltae]MCS3921580.1 hypothetical protein [Methanococcus voltae PS]